MMPISPRHELLVARQRHQELVDQVRAERMVATIPKVAGRRTSLLARAAGPVAALTRRERRSGRGRTQRHGVGLLRRLIRHT